MNDLVTLVTIVLIVFGVWLAALTLVTGLTVRQIALLTLRLSMWADQNTDQMEPTSVPSFWLDNDGPEVGSQIPVEVVKQLPELERERIYILLLSSTCTPCRKVAIEVAKHRFDPSTSIMALVPGPEDLANALIEILPPEIHTIRNPVAVSIAQSLNIKSTPFALAIENGIVVKKAYMHRSTDFSHFVEEKVPSEASKTDHSHKEVTYVS